MNLPTSYKVGILGLLTLAAIIYPKPAHANLGDTRAQSAKRYGKPWSTKADRTFYETRAWFVDERFNSAGYAIEVSYTKKDGSISDDEAAQFASVNVPKFAQARWTPIIPTGDPSLIIGKIWVSEDANFRWEGGSIRLFQDNRWFSYLTLSFIGDPSINQTSTSETYLPL
jgi:hypothetical protein